MRKNEMSEDDIQQMLTQIFHESDYKVERRDPVIVPYIVQKNMLLDFKKDVGVLFDEFSGKVLPPLQAETEKLRKQRNELLELASGTANGIVREAGEKFNRHMQESSCAEIDAAVLRHLTKLTQDLRDTELQLVVKLEQQREAFENTAANFTDYLFALVAGMVALFVGTIVWWTWLK